MKYIVSSVKCEIPAKYASENVVYMNLEFRVRVEIEIYESPAHNWEVKPRM